MDEYFYVIGFVVVAVVFVELITSLLSPNWEEWVRAKYRYYRIMASVIAAIFATFLLMSIISRYTNIG